jgi:hypothetical protein
MPGKAIFGTIIDLLIDFGNGKGIASPDVLVITGFRVEVTWQTGSIYVTVKRVAVPRL